MKGMAAARMGLVACVAIAAACGGGGGGGRAETATPITISDSPATDGVFDAAPADGGDGRLWMSHSIVLTSPRHASLNQVRTRIARSDDGGATWRDVGTDPNQVADPDLIVPDGRGGTTWATWRFEVSRLVYDPYDADESARWKMVWHRMLAAVIDGVVVRLPENSWIGYTTAATPTGPWSAERKLFTGSLYNTALDAIIGAPEFPLAGSYPEADTLGDCGAFTEPGLLARPEALYISLQCSAGGKVVLLSCDRALSSCAYLGDMLPGGEAAAFGLAGEPVSGFAATELVEIGGTVYLLVSGHDVAADMYRGCLVFRVSDLATAAVERRDGQPVLVSRVSGSTGSFNGACGYDPAATASGIIYSEYRDTTPRFRLFASHQPLPGD